MTLSFPTRRAGILIAIAAAVAVLALVATCHHPMQPLPVALKKAVDDHAQRTVAETAETHRLERAAIVAKTVERTHVALGEVHDAHAASLGARADSETIVAARATTASDSAKALSAALTERSAEVDTLKRSIAERDTAIAKADTVADSLAKADTINDHRAARGDSVLATAITVVEHSDPPCTLLHFFPCPSRTVVAVAGVAVGVVGTITAILAAHGAHHAVVAPVASVRGVGWLAPQF